MGTLDKLKAEMNGLQERFLEKDTHFMSAMIDPSGIPNDMADLAAMERGRIDTPNAEKNGLKSDPSPEDEAKSKEEPIAEPEIDADADEDDIKAMDSAQVKESLLLALEIAFECVQKSQMILKTLVGGEGKADLKEVVDKEMLEKANDVVEEYIELVEYMEEIDSDESDAAPEEEPEDNPEEEPETAEQPDEEEPEEDDANPEEKE